MSVIWWPQLVFRVHQRLNVWRREQAAEPVVARAFEEWRGMTQVEGDCFDPANVQRFHAWLTVAYPDVTTELPEHERTEFVVRCVRHLAVKAGRYRSFLANRSRPRRKAAKREGEDADEGADET